MAADDAVLTDAVEELRKAILAADKAKLSALTASELTYGHSSGVVQDQATFIDGVVHRKATFKSLDFPDLKTFVAGDVGVGVTAMFWSFGQRARRQGHPRRYRVIAVWQQQGGQ